VRLARAETSDGCLPVIGTSDGNWYDLSPATADIDSAFIARGLEDIRGMLSDGRLARVDVSDFLAPIADIGKIVCIGLNYGDHARETGAEIPAEPIVFLKSPDTVVAANSSVFIPPGSIKTDYEVELAVVIGAQARYLESPAGAAAAIAGYAMSNDFSEREFQLERGGQWDKGKNCETFNPFGPWILTPDDVLDPQSLGLSLWVNGEIRQSGNTTDMIFDVAYVVWCLSQFMVLYPGDVINTGTPAGVALGRADGQFLRPGDVVELEIDGLGRRRQMMRQA
jgi:2-keto-4-pentenoate hydratase/2-oxohepta-3-ene-1,7-dioic acid hydratase in catechol pathway